MAHENLFSTLAAGYAADPTAACLELRDGTLRSFAEIDLESAQLAARLAREGVGSGDRVVVQAEKSPRIVSLYLACLRRGAIYVPLNSAYTPREVEGFLADAEPALFVCEAGRELGKGQRGRASLATLEASGDGSLTEGLDADADTSVAECEPDDLAALLYTSGTTGRSKGAMLSHRNLASNARALHACWAFEPGDVLLHVLPLYHAHGLFVALHTALLNGSRILFEERFDVEAVVERLRRASVFMGVPTHYVRLLERPELTPERCASMRLFVSGSAPLLAETHREFTSRTHHQILERYGMTETGMIASNPYDGERVPGSVGYALPGVEVRVCGDDAKPVAVGEIGVLEVRGPNVFSGYWRMPEKTREELRDDGFFVTGDLAEEEPDGRIRLVGRAKDLVISGGLNVYPKEVESLLDALPGVQESAVIGLPHADFGEGVTAVVVLEAGAEEDEAALLAALGGELARFKQPKRVFFVDALPRNAMGKVQKNLLRDRYASAYESGEHGQDA
jgi:malonyl-CoA/methylmalonyl-CoA synthetase